MNPKSPLFDKIRIPPRSGRRSAQAEPEEKMCDKPGCAQKGAFKAPKGRSAEGQFWNFCKVHVKEYNQSFNYFAGMSDNAISTFQRDAMLGHRPTWKLGENAASGKRSARRAAPKEEVFVDPFGVFDEATRPKRKVKVDEPTTPKIGPLAKRAFEILNCEVTTDAAVIKLRYKELVKMYHPDTNGGDRSLEDRLREIINAYNTLKAAGFA